MGGHHFAGAKIALFHGETILTYLRDDIETIPFPGRWDLPGGGREGAESPLEWYPSAEPFNYPYFASESIGAV